MMREHAVVIGGSMAGLVAASALARHFRRVTVLDRDSLHDDDRARKGAPQAQHVHVLLASGLQALGHFHPGFAAEMVKGGVAKLGWSEDMRWFQHGSWKTRQACGLSFYPQSRARLEGHLRARTRELPHVEILDGHSVQGLLFDAAAEQVLGVHVANAITAFDIAADLVVDASGRGSQSLKWLQQAGHALPPKEVLPIDLAYVTQVFQQPVAHRP